ncbi:MAG TPA: carbon storage regulator CsrA [Pseudomonas sp.]|uniref:carbon storage regulator CsrA n=1 Tax=Pseudomonas sp. TaxID=306 RepID=UPI002B474210|nr:carbon storage regulator CsrA [Pseudomonas sp.]HKS12094.1 carbon storage regulator CsrA [Pseudomonas sp.]
MLVIGREVGEVIAINDDIKIKVISVEGGAVRFGICAPREIKVHRTEVYRRIQAKEAKQATKQAGSA